MIVKIHTLPAFTDNYIYVLQNEAGDCAVVDPGEAAPVRAYIQANALRLRTILCTHFHDDHVGGVEELAQEPDMEVWAAPGDYERIQGANRKVHGDETLKLLGEDIEIIAVPGHTDGQVSYYFPRLAAIFTGDTLFSCGCGRMFEGNYPQFFASLQKYKTLPPETKMYFGHEYTERNIRFSEGIFGAQPKLEEYKRACQKARANGQFTTPSTLALEFEINPFLDAKSVAEFQMRRQARDRF